MTPRQAKHLAIPNFIRAASYGSSSDTELPTDNPIHAWGDPGWGDCSAVEGGLDAAISACKCSGYDGVSGQTPCFQTEVDTSYHWNIPTGCDKPWVAGVADGSGNGHGMTKIRCSSTGCTGSGFTPTDAKPCCSNTPLCSKDNFCRTTDYCNSIAGSASMNVVDIWWWSGSRSVIKSFANKCGQTVVERDVSAFDILIENRGNASGFVGANIVDSGEKQISTSSQMQIPPGGKATVSIPFTPPDSGGAFEVRVYDVDASTGTSIRNTFSCGFSVPKAPPVPPPKVVSHNECVNGKCKAVLGEGDDACVTGHDAACKSAAKPQQHYECVQEKCLAVPGAGTDLCTPGVDATCVTKTACPGGIDIGGGTCIPVLALIAVPLLLVMVMMAK